MIFYLKKDKVWRIDFCCGQMFDWFNDGSVQVSQVSYSEKMGYKRAYLSMFGATETIGINHCPSCGAKTEGIFE